MRNSFNPEPNNSMPIEECSKKECPIHCIACNNKLSYNSHQIFPTPNPFWSDERKFPGTARGIYSYELWRRTWARKAGSGRDFSRSIRSGARKFQTLPRSRTPVQFMLHFDWLANRVRLGLSSSKTAFRNSAHFQPILTNFRLLLTGAKSGHFNSNFSC